MLWIKQNKEKLFVVVAYLVMIGLNGLANILPIGGLTTGQVSDRYSNLFTPSGITFGIWGLIYLLLGMLVVQMLKKEGPKGAFLLVSINFLLNGVWLVLWHYELLLISLLVMAGILGSLIALNRQTWVKEDGLAKLALGVYFGWITVATLANAAAYFVALGWRGAPLSESVVTMLVIGLASLIITVTGYRLQSISYEFVGLWAFLGILLRQVGADGLDMKYPGIIICLVVGMIFMIFAITLILREKKSTYMKSST